MAALAYAPRMKLEASRVALTFLMVSIGILHFTHTEGFASIVPDFLPWHEGLVLVSGVFEIGLGLALLVERTRVLAAYGLIALFIAVFPANLNMALHPELRIAGLPLEPSPVALWLRLPFQLVLIWWAWRYTKRPQADQSTTPSDLASSRT
jgi:uncharacterized membrane protein